jgi:hypothetical protein
MPVNGAWAKPMFSSEVGTIGTTWTFTKQQSFSPPANLLAYPVLQYISESDDETQTIAYVSKFVDDGTSHSGKFVGVAATKCSSIEWSLYCDHSFNNPLRTIFFF